MKKNLLSIGIIVLILFTQSCWLNAQEEVTPEPVKTAFLEKYPKATDVFWVAEYDEYIASFENTNFELVMVTFNKQGDWSQTDTSIAVDALPILAQASIQEAFKAEEFYTTNKIETPNKVFYTTTFETATQMVTLTFDEKGKVTDKIVEDF